MGMRSTWWGEIYGKSRGDLGEIQGPPHLLRPRLEPELDARAGIMQPVKNGRTDMPSGVALLEGPPAGASSDGQLQARPAAPDQLQVAPPPPPPAPAPAPSRPLGPRLLARGSRGLLVRLRRRCRRRAIWRRCKTRRRRAACRAWRRG